MLWQITAFIKNNQFKIIRFLIAGGSAALTQLSLTYILTDIVGIWYVISAVLSVAVAFVVSFTLQKFWAFKNFSKDKLLLQLFLYLVFLIWNMSLTGFASYILVDYVHLHYLLAQVFIGGVIAVQNFFLYQNYIFRI